MRTSRSTLRSMLAAVAVAAATLAIAPAAYADQDKPQEPAKEDSRAVVHEGNISGNVDMCAAVDAAGNVIDTGDIGFKVTPRRNEDRRLTISSIPDNKTITAIVLKGGPRYNVYVPGEHGLSVQAPWEDLRAPVNNGGNIAAISHWYACWVHSNPATADAPPTKDTATANPTGTATSTPTTGAAVTVPGGAASTSPSAGTTSTPSSSGPATPEATSTTNAAGPVSSDDTETLAYTGFSNAWLIWLGGALVLAGAAALVLLRVRRSRG